MKRSRGRVDENKEKLFPVELLVMTFSGKLSMLFKMRNTLTDRNRSLSLKFYIVVLGGVVIRALGGYGCHIGRIIINKVCNPISNVSICSAIRYIFAFCKV